MLLSMPPAVDKPMKKSPTTEELLRWRVKGYTIRDIAEKYGLHPSGVAARLKRFEKLLGDPAEILAYRTHEADILDAARLRLVTSLVSKTSGKEAKKASINNLAYAFTQINQAVRLLRGQSTQNVSALTRIIEQAGKSTPTYSVPPQYMDSGTKINTDTPLHNPDPDVLTITNPSNIK